jgi:hypothetical protein
VNIHHLDSSSVALSRRIRPETIENSINCSPDSVSYAVGQAFESPLRNGKAFGILFGKRSRLASY